MKNETLETTWAKFLPHEATEENEKLGSSGNDVDQVIAMLQRIPGCNDCDCDNRAHYLTKSPKQRPRSEWSTRNQ